MITRTTLLKDYEINFNRMIKGGSVKFHITNNIGMMFNVYIDENKFSYDEYGNVDNAKECIVLDEVYFCDENDNFIEYKKTQELLNYNDDEIDDLYDLVVKTAYDVIEDEVLKIY